MQWMGMDGNGRMIIVMKWIIPESSLRLAPVFVIYDLHIMEQTPSTSKNLCGLIG